MATADQFEPAERLEYEVFEEIGFCRTSSLGRVEEFDEWRDRSEFRVVTDDADVIKGVVRVLLGQYDDLPIGSFPKYRDYPPDPILEYASLAVPVDVRRSGVAEALYRGVWQDAIRSGAGGIAGIGAPWLLDILNGVYNFGFERTGRRSVLHGRRLHTRRYRRSVPDPTVEESTVILPMGDR